MRWLVDTGASLSAVKLQTINVLNVPIHKQSTFVNGIGGQLRTEGYVYLDIAICGQINSHKFHVFKKIPHETDGIIGQDFLIKYNCNINYELNTFSLYYLDEYYTIPLELGKQTKEKYITVPPRCERIFYVNTKLSEDCVIESKELCQGVFFCI